MEDSLKPTDELERDPTKRIEIAIQGFLDRETFLFRLGPGSLNKLVRKLLAIKRSRKTLLSAGGRWADEFEIEIKTKELSRGSRIS